MFRKFIRWITQPWVIALFIVLSFSLIVWFVGPLIAVAEYKPLAKEGVRFLVILTLFLIWGLSNLRSRAREKKATEAFDKKLVEEVETEKKTAAPIDAESQVLSDKLKTALQTLSKAQSGKGIRLYQLPWYVIIGAPGSGKTTILNNSGLEFPLQSELGETAIKGAGGTRHCDWWFTNEAVFIDTAGRYTVQDTPQKTEAKAWLNFLAMLRKSRPKRPLNGVLVTINLLDILQKTPMQKSLQAAAIKRRIQELNDHLGMSLPVYVLFTKCDLVSGFKEFFADLDAADRDQAWGITFSLNRSKKAGAVLDAFDEMHAELVKRVASRQLARFSEEKDAIRRLLIHEFPQQLNTVYAKAKNFLAEIFSPNQFEQVALLRGIYYMSGTQTASSTVRANGVIPSEYCSAPVTAAGVKEPKGFFIKDVFNRIIFPESGLATTDKRTTRRFYWATRGAATLLLVTFAFAAYLWGNSYVKNTHYLTAVDDHLAAYKPLPESQAATARKWVDMAESLDVLRSLPTGYDEGYEDRPLPMGFGLYQGDKIGAQAHITYLKALERYFLPALTQQLVTQIQQAASDEEYLYEALRFYLMLYHPDKMERDSFALWMNLMFERLLPGDANAQSRESLATHLKAALDEQLPLPAIERDTVDQAREILANTPLDLRMYRRLKNDYLSDNRREISVKSVLGNRAEIIFYRRSGKPLEEGISTLFTYESFHTKFYPQLGQLSKRLADDQWIYGDENKPVLDDAAQEDLQERVKGHYFAEYTARWEAYLGDLVINSFSTPARGRTVLHVLAGADAPIPEWLQAVHKNLALSVPPESAKAVAQVADVVTDMKMSNQKSRFERLMPDSDEAYVVRLPGQEVNDAFPALLNYASLKESVPLQELQAALVQLNQYFDTLVYSNDLKAAAFNANSQNSQGGGPLFDVKRTLGMAPPVVRSWFGSIVGDAQRVTAVAAKGHMNDAWHSDVYEFFKVAIEGRYPVDRNSEQEVTLDDFAKFFGPQGKLDNYFNQFVKPFVDTTQSQWRWTQSTGMSDSTLAIFQRAKRIQAAYFTGGEKVQVRFQLQPQFLDNVASQFILEIGDTRIAYQHGPLNKQTVVWPGEKTESRFTFSLVSKGSPIMASEDGPWSLFRLLDKYGSVAKGPSRGSYLITLSKSALKARFELIPQSAYNPFARDDLGGFALPDKL